MDYLIIQWDSFNLSRTIKMQQETTMPTSIKVASDQNVEEESKVAGKWTIPVNNSKGRGRNL